LTERIALFDPGPKASRCMSRQPRRTEQLISVRQPRSWKPRRHGSARPSA